MLRPSKATACIMITSLLGPRACRSLSTASSGKGRLVVLGGTGFLGSEVCSQAVAKGYQVTSLSRNPAREDTVAGVDYVKGDARKEEDVRGLFASDGHVPLAGVVHCIGLLFDSDSGLGDWNRFVSGSGSVPDAESTYETITRQTAFLAIDAAAKYSSENQQVPFVFTSAAEAGWPEMTGGNFVESNLAPDFLQRYLVAKRAVEEKLSNEDSLRSVVVRPSLIYAFDRLASLPAVGAFFVGNAIGLPFVDQPVTVDKLAACMIQAIDDTSVAGTLRYKDINRLASKSR